jgi:hypothetical protein
MRGRGSKYSMQDAAGQAKRLGGMLGEGHDLG